MDVLAAEGDGAYGRENAEVICSFGSSDYYLCVNIQRDDLLQELNQAQAELAIEEPDYLTKPVNLTQLEEMLLKTLPPEKIQKIEASETTPETEPETVLPEAIQALPQLDTEEGIDYCGDTEDYLEALKIWHASAEEKAKNLEILLQEDNLNEYTLLVHSMKSMLRSIGANELSDRAAALEAAAGKEDVTTLRRDTHGFTDQIRELREVLKVSLSHAD